MTAVVCRSGPGQNCLRCNESVRFFGVRLSLVLLVFSDLFGPDTHLRSGGGVVGRADVGEEGDGETDCKDGGGRQEDKLPVAFKFQMHEVHHDAGGLGAGDGQYEHDGDGFGELQHVEDDRERRAAAEYKEDGEVADVVV